MKQKQSGIRLLVFLLQAMVMMKLLPSLSATSAILVTVGHVRSAITTELPIPYISTLLTLLKPLHRRRTNLNTSVFQSAVSK